MSDETGKVDREAHRRDGDGDLSVWGARDVILTLLAQEVTQGSAWWHNEELDRALDDLEDAVIRTHDDFGCWVLAERDDETGEERPRYTCRMCLAGSELTREQREEILVSLEQLARGEVTPAVPLDVDVNVDVNVDVDGDFVAQAEEVLRGGRKLHASCEHVTMTPAAPLDVATAADDLAAWYDGLNADDQDVQTGSEDVILNAAGQPASVRLTELSKALVLSAGDVIDIGLTLDEAGKLVVTTWEVIRGGCGTREA